MNDIVRTFESSVQCQALTVRTGTCCTARGVCAPHTFLAVDFVYRYQSLRRVALVRAGGGFATKTSQGTCVALVSMRARARDMYIGTDMRRFGSDASANN